MRNSERYIRSSCILIHELRNTHGFGEINLNVFRIHIPNTRKKKCIQNIYLKNMHSPR